MPNLNKMKSIRFNACLLALLSLLVLSFQNCSSPTEENSLTELASSLEDVSDDLTQADLFKSAPMDSLSCFRDMATVSQLISNTNSTSQPKSSATANSPPGHPY